MNDLVSAGGFDAYLRGAASQDRETRSSHEANVEALFTKYATLKQQVNEQFRLLREELARITQTMPTWKAGRCTSQNDPWLARCVNLGNVSAAEVARFNVELNMDMAQRYLRFDYCNQFTAGESYPKVKCTREEEDVWTRITNPGNLDRSLWLPQGYSDSHSTIDVEEVTTFAQQCKIAQLTAFSGHIMFYNSQTKKFPKIKFDLSEFYHKGTIIEQALAKMNNHLATLTIAQPKPGTTLHRFDGPVGFDLETFLRINPIKLAQLAFVCTRENIRIIDALKKIGLQYYDPVKRDQLELEL